jgi:hypothetical protein
MKSSGRGGKNFFRLFFVLALCCSSYAAAAELRRDSSSRIDHFLDCATRILGRPVLVHALPGPGLAAINCQNVDIESFTARLQEGGYTLLLTPDWALVVDFATQSREHWKDLKVDVQLNEKKSDSPPLSSATLDRLKHALLTQMRFFPAEALQSSYGSSTAHYLLLFDVYRRRIDGKDAAIVLVHLGENVPDLDPEDPSGRVIYGELSGDVAELRWQSPIVQTNGELQFDDIDGDGVPEIVLWSRWIATTRMTWQALTIFDREGHELTRQKDCEFEGGATILGGTTCPVVGTEVRIISGVTPKLITYWGGPNEENNVVLKLVNGRFVRITKRASEKDSGTTSKH